MKAHGEVVALQALDSRRGDEGGKGRALLELLFFECIV